MSEFIYHAMDRHLYKTEYAKLADRMFDAVKQTEPVQFPINEKGQKIYRLINGRHPFSRLWSCYNDKFVLWDRETRKNGSNAADKNSTSQKHQTLYSNQKHDTTILRIFKNTHAAATKFETPESLKTIQQPKYQKTSFTAFLRLLIHGKGLTNLSNKHWIPIYKLCNTCFVNFNVFTKLEFIDYDLEILKEKLDLKNIGNFPQRRVGSSDSKNETDVKTVQTVEKSEKNLTQILENSVKKYNQMVEKLLPEFAYLTLGERQKLFQIYQPDFELFDYDFAPFNRKNSELLSKNPLPDRYRLKL